MALTGCFEAPQYEEEGLSNESPNQEKPEDNTQNEQDSNGDSENPNTDNQTGGQTGNQDNSQDDSQDDSQDGSQDNTQTESPLSQMMFPQAGYVISKNSVTLLFQDKGRMWLDLGSTLNGSDIANTSISGTQYLVSMLPANLTTLYATLWTYTEGEWKNNQYQWSVNYADKDTDSNNGTDNTLAAGKAIWEANCTNSACHAKGAVNGVFSESSLSTKGVFNTLQLANYIHTYMPLIGPDACQDECATDVANYIASWHSLPTDTSGNTGTGSPRNPVVVEQCNTETSVGYQTLRLLTRDQYQNSVSDLLGVNFDLRTQLPVDLESGAFTNNNDLSVLDSAYIGYVGAAESIAEWSANRNFSDFMQCASFNASCATQFIDQHAWKLIRRPFTNTERQQYLAMASGQDTNGNVKEGIQLALSGLLSSPQFLYRHEIGEPATGMGNGVYQLTPYELATFLSYSFSDTTPDATLLAAAKNGQLSTDSQITAQVSRLLDSDNASAMMEDMVHDWLGTDFILSQHKDTSQFPNFKTVAPHMMTELSKVFSNVMLNKSERYESLYSAGYTYLNQPLAQHYGVGGVSGSQFRKVFTQDRGGVLLSGAFLSRWAHTDETNAVTRSVHIRRDMLCQDIPEPPTGVSLSLQDKKGELADILADPKTTQRMAFKHTTEFGSCSACHNEIINPLGFGLEDYNAVGVKRAFDANGNSIDATGALWSPFLQLQFYDDPNRVRDVTEFEGGKQLGELLAHDPKISGLAKSCLAKQMLSYVSGIDARAYSGSERENVVQLGSSEKNGYTCDVMDLVDTLSNESPRAMLEKIGTLESIRFRKAWSR